MKKPSDIQLEAVRVLNVVKEINEVVWNTESADGRYSLLMYGPSETNICAEALASLGDAADMILSSLRIDLRSETIVRDAAGPYLKLVQEDETWQSADAE